jgi:RimJ/RimL family protein N-acetyltransferase
VQSYDADEAGGAGVDLFIGEPEHVGRGVGAEALRRFVDEVVFGREGARFCIADPHPENRASVRAFEKAGFRSRGESTDAVHLLRRDHEADGETGRVCRRAGFRSFGLRKLLRASVPA